MTPTEFAAGYALYGTLSKHLLQESRESVGIRNLSVMSYAQGFSILSIRQPQSLFADVVSSESITKFFLDHRDGGTIDGDVVYIRCLEGMIMSSIYQHWDHKTLRGHITWKIMAWEGPDLDIYPKVISVSCAKGGQETIRVEILR